MLATAPVAPAEPLAIARIDTTEPVVALTFDACANHEQSNSFDRPLFDMIRAAKMPVTVFMSGLWIEAHPDEAREIANQPFVEIGNHGYAHAHWPSLSKAEYAKEIDRTEMLIKLLGKKSVGARPPFGEWNPTTLAANASRGLPTILWDVVSGDAGGHVPAARMTETVLAHAKPGSIVIFHINGRGPLTKDALPNIAVGLAKKGMRFVLMSELLRGAKGKVVAAPKYIRGVAVRGRGESLNDVGEAPALETTPAAAKKAPAKINVVPPG